MPTKTKDSDDAPKLTDEEFRAAQKAKAAEQNQLAPNAVPEQRPAAAQQPPDTEHPVTKKLREEGALQTEPMPQEAFEQAASKSAAKEAEKNSVQESIREGARVRIIDGPYEGSTGAVTGVTYEDFEETQKARSGVPAVANYAKVGEIQVRTRGARDDLVSLKPDQVELIETLGIPRHDEEA